MDVTDERSMLMNEGVNGEAECYIGVGVIRDGSVWGCLGGRVGGLSL